MTGRERPFRFGVMGESIQTRRQLIEEARRAEDLGYSSFLLRDHFIREPFGDQLAPMVALMAVADATQKLRIGTLVLANDYRHPALVAKEAATLDLLSGGRFELGMGAGWLRDEFDRAGISFDPPPERVSRLEESLSVLIQLLQESELVFAGHHYSIRGLQTFPKPVQQPHPPIIVGAGSRRMLSIAGGKADVVSILPKALPTGSISQALSERSPETIGRKVELVRQAAGNRFDDIELNMLPTVSITDNRRGAAEKLAATQGWTSAAIDHVLQMPSVLIGSVRAVINQLEAQRDLYSFSYYAISDKDMELFAPVVEQLRGR